MTSRGQKKDLQKTAPTGSTTFHFHLANGKLAKIKFSISFVFYKCAIVYLHAIGIEKNC